MRNKLLYILPFVAVFALALVVRGRASQPNLEKTAPAREVWVAGPGRVEPISEEIKVGAEVRGKIKAVRVEEGDRVRQGQIIAILENDDVLAECASAEAQLEEKKAELRRVINGARDQERREALAAVKEAEAVLENASAEVARRQGLFRDGVIARDETDRAVREYGVAKARLDAAVAHHAVVDDAAREEDRSRAEAQVALARARIAEVRARWEKTFIRAPISSVILRKHLKPGETVSDMRDTPIFTLADSSTLRVRVDVDETDVGKVHLGQRAYVTADAYQGKKFWGRVVRVGRVLGKKNIRTDEPTERVDTKILETLIELEQGQFLPLGLRVDAFLLAR